MKAERFEMQSKFLCHKIWAVLKFEYILYVMSCADICAKYA